MMVIRRRPGATGLSAIRVHRGLIVHAADPGREADDALDRVLLAPGPHRSGERHDALRHADADASGFALGLPLEGLLDLALDLVGMDGPGRDRDLAKNAEKQREAYSGKKRPTRTKT
jgi:hypothetical protein